MRVKKIQVTNYKGFKDCSVEFHPNVNVFIGSNASGKTSLLKAIVKPIYSGITAAVANTPNQNKSLVIEPNDLNYKANFLSIITWLFDFPQYSEDLSIILSTNPDSSYQQAMNEHHNKRSKFLTWLNRLASTTTLTVPIIKFYPANRGAIGYTQERHHQQPLQISQFEAWTNIYQDNLSYSKFFKWFLENETNELLLQRDAQDFNIQNPALRDVRKALNKAFEFIGYDQCRIKVKQIKREGSNELIPTLVLEEIKSKKEESLDNKSDGEKAIITLIADIAYNLSLAKDFVYNDDFLDSPGIVLIDEIETHLHPNWQRQILPMLTTIFPNIQFFVTTHSPQIISSIRSECVFAMENFQVKRVHLKTLGEDSNSLLKYVFDATERPLEYVSLIEHFDQLMDNRADYVKLEEVINEIFVKENQDTAQNMSNLITKLRLQLEAYKFDREHEKDN